MNKEATARIKINRLLEDAGWRFFDDRNGPANIQIEPNVKLTEGALDDLGEDFEKTKNGFIDFLLEGKAHDASVDDTARSDLAATTMGYSPASLERLMDENDQDLYRWITGVEPAPEPFSALVDTIARETRQRLEIARRPRS